MRYYYEKPEVWVGAGKTQKCDHPMYNSCTVFAEDDKGIALIQQHFNEKTKVSWWGPVDPWLAGDIYLHPDFADLFDAIAEAPSEKGTYPTLPVRRIMWMLRMKPLRREFWEEFSP